MKRQLVWVFLAFGCSGRVPGPEPPPLGLDWAMQAPADNLPARSTIELGRRLFFDPLLSADGKVSCSTCHRPDRAFSDSAAVSRGVHGRPGTRNAPPLANAGYRTTLSWDGRNETLEQQVLRPFQDSLELGLTVDQLEHRLASSAAYRHHFQRVFGRDPRHDDVGRALASFVRSLRSGDSQFDRYRNGDSTALSVAALEGLRLFNGKARCALCHIGPLFSDGRFHNTGNGVRSGDLGRFRVTGDPADRHAFRTATLRDVAQTAPYMHDGGVATLEDVIEFYDRGGIANAQLDRELVPLRLTVQEKHALTAFLRSLTGAAMIAERSLTSRPPAVPK